MNNYDMIKQAIDQADQLEIPFFCFDPEIVNLRSAFNQFIFSANCAALADALAVFDSTGCLDSGLL